MVKSKLISVLLASTILLSGCGAKSTTNVGASKKNTTASAVDLSKVTLIVGETGWKSKEAELKAASLSDTPYKVEYVNFQGGNLQLQAIAGNHLDLALTSEIPPIFASLSANGGNFKIIAVQEGTTLQQELVIPKGSLIKNVADLKGKKVAYVNSTTANYFLLKMLQKSGLAWKDIIPEQMTPADGLTALLGGKVDALASYGNSIISAHKNGATLLVSAKDILSGNFPIEATPEAISDPGKHAAIVDYLARYNKAQVWARSNANEWSKITAAATNQSVNQALATFKDGEAQKSTKIVPNSIKAIASQQDIADTFFNVKLLKNKIDVSSLWSNAFDKEIKNISIK